jgi:hypothetical protein
MNPLLSRWRATACRRLAAGALLAGISLAAVSASPANPPTTPAATAAEPTTRVELSPAGPALVGQPVQITVTVLAPDYFLSAPPFPPLAVAGAVVTMPDERGLNGTEVIDGVTYASVRKTYVFTTQTPGTYQLPQPVLHFTYAGADGAPRDASVPMPAITIQARAQGGAPAASRVPGPASAAKPAGTPALPVGPISVRQQFDRATDGATLRAGDALVRTITTFAPGSPAMMIPPPTLRAPRGVRMFTSDPRLADGVADANSGGTGGRRTDVVTYVFEDSGSVTLPAVVVDWYDPVRHGPSHSEAPAVTLRVGSARARGGLAPDGIGGASLDSERGWPEWVNWRTVGAAGFVILLAALLWGPARRRLLPAIAATRAARAESVQQRTLFDLARQACQGEDALAAYRAVDDWARRASGQALLPWARSTGDAALGHAVDDLCRHAFGAGRAGGSGWHGSALAAALSRHQPAPGRRWRPARKPAAPALPPLNAPMRGKP